MNENVDFIARCISGSALETSRKAVSDLGGMQILKISKSDFDNIEHDPNTIYFVVDGDKITQYIGDSKLSSGLVISGLNYILLNGDKGVTGDFIRKDD